jgi:hypothetical protein
VEQQMQKTRFLMIAAAAAAAAQHTEERPLFSDEQLAAADLELAQDKAARYHRANDQRALDLQHSHPDRF